MCFWHQNYPDHPLLEPEHALDDIKVEYHPSSGIEAKVYPFHGFQRRPMASSEASHSAEPWRPFQSCLEFELAELALEAGLNNHKTDQLIKLCHCCIVGKEKFSFKTHKDIHVKWEAASVRVTKVVWLFVFINQILIFFEAQFTKEVISVPYDGKTWDFDLHYRDLWGLATDLLGDPHLFPHLTFNAQRLSKFDGDTFIRFVDEPFTAQDFWNVQVCINVCMIVC